MGTAIILIDNHHPPDPRVVMHSTILGEAGLQPEVVAWDKRADVTGDSVHRAAGSVTHRLWVPAGSGMGAKKLPLLWRFWRRAIDLVRSLSSNDVGPNSPRLVVANDVYMLPLGYFMARRLGIPLVYDAHEDFRAMEASRLSSAVITIVEAVETLLARRAALVIVPGESRTDRWSRKGVTPMVLPNLRPPSGHTENGDEYVETRWDIAYCGTLVSQRRIDLLLEVARRCPELRIAIGGAGRIGDSVEAQAAELDNVDYLGWVHDPESVMQRARAVYYGLDSAHPYSAKACPNNLYQAMLARRPLVFFCGGEPEWFNLRFSVGVQCRPTAEELAEAISAATDSNARWGFERAVASAEASASRSREDYAAFIRVALRE